ncbi:serine/threonine-protein kinase RIO3 [Lates japonicus]|uniref:Serine/threonine-protein kinase RIO3 n=1 Tax=Lates japonicus TaxID=270547 RepID=A0AAD3R6D9_LATJO|nr:serine/threonine-protein kinase RIO3 [Lates japonicus]
MDRTGVTTETPKSPWGSVAPAAPACSLVDVMSEQLARQLDEENNAFPALAEPGADLLLSDENPDTTSDLMLLELSISFENYRMVHPYEDSDSSEDEVDWQDTRHDPYRAEKPQTTPRRGFTGKGKNITTKHDEEMCGRKNTARMDNLSEQHCYSEPRRSRLREGALHRVRARRSTHTQTRNAIHKILVSSSFLSPQEQRWTLAARLLILEEQSGPSSGAEGFKSGGS